MKILSFWILCNIADKMDITILSIKCTSLFWPVFWIYIILNIWLEWNKAQNKSKGAN